MQNPSRALRAQEKAKTIRAPKSPVIILVDLYAGGGGTSLGAQKSGYVRVIAAVNHDELAIASHRMNFKKGVRHLQEDTRLVNVIELASYCKQMRAKYPGARLVLWASLECTHFSQAKGGQSRDADSRTLAHDLIRYIRAIEPDYLKIENVKEFMSWGDLDENGKPVSKNAGKDYIRWVWSIEALGYRYDYRLLNAADYGAATSRIRYFGIFAKGDMPIAFPEPTHQSKKAGVLFQNGSTSKKIWRPAADCLDLHDRGTSIFDKKKPPVAATLRRLLGGLKKFVKTPEQMVMTCNNPGYCQGVSAPCSTVTTAGHKQLVTPVRVVTPFLMTYYKNGQCVSVNNPCPVIPTKDRVMLASVVQQSLGLSFLMTYYTNAGYFRLNQPCPTITTRDKVGFISLRFDINSAFIINPQFSDNGRSIQDPCPTVVASQKSFPLGICIPARQGPPRWEIKDGDSPEMINIKNFMKAHGITDIFTRMLKVIELKKIQGFPADYVLLGNQDEQKKMIGNAVEVCVGTALFASTARAIIEYNQRKAA